MLLIFAFSIVTHTVHLSKYRCQQTYDIFMYYGDNYFITKCSCDMKCMTCFGSKPFKLFMFIYNLQQFISSLPSEHVLYPLHREEEEIHWPLVHRNWLEVHPKEIE